MFLCSGIITLVFSQTLIPKTFPSSHCAASCMLPSLLKPWALVFHCRGPLRSILVSGKWLCDRTLS